MFDVYCQVRRVHAHAPLHRPHWSSHTPTPRRSQSVTQLRAMALVRLPCYQHYHTSPVALTRTARPHPAKADFESICSSGRIRATLNALDEACDARGVTDFGVDARASRCVARSRCGWEAVRGASRPVVGFEQTALGGGASLSALRCAGLTRPFSRPAPATVDPEDAARAARCAAKQAELERLHAEIAEVRCFNALHSSHAPTSHGWVDTHTHRWRKLTRLSWRPWRNAVRRWQRQL